MGTNFCIRRVKPREVAERLRELRGGWSSGECYYTIIHALCLPDTSREDGGHALYSLLADLIDPDCEEGRYSVARTARPVDREALLALADEMDEVRVTGWRCGHVIGGEHVIEMEGE